MKNYIKPFLPILLISIVFSNKVSASEPTAQSTRTITGSVYDRDGESVIGALVQDNANHSITTVTDIDGHFSLTDVPDSCVLTVSYIGYSPESIEVVPDVSFYPVTLTPVSSEIQEVVVVGYGTQKKTDLTGSVSSIGRRKLNDRPITNVTDALAGLAPGLTVTNSGGNTPGFEEQTIRVRGQGTLNDAAPLVVVDGMTGIALSDINPKDIDNISILKDAASASIYGSRAANGVILVTTRTGRERAPRITYNGNVSFETVAKRLNLVTDYADFMEIQNSGLIANGQAPRFSEGKINEWRNDGGKNPTVYPNTDWQDHIYRNPSVVQNHNLTVTGGSKTVRYNFSLGFIDNPGMIYHTNYRRYQLRTSTEADIKHWLTVGLSVFGYYDTNDPSSDVAADGGDVIWGSGAFNTVPGMTLYDPATGLYGGIQNPEEENVSNFNPYRRMWFYKSEFPIRTWRGVAKTYAVVRPVKGLTIQGSFSYNYWQRKREEQLMDKDLYRFTLDGPILLREGTVRTYIRRYGYENIFRSSELTASYDFTVSKLSSTVLLGMSQEYNKYDADYFRKYDLIDDSMTSLDGATTVGEITGNYTEWAMRSYFGRINLNWDDKYLLQANIRADGSSRFSPSKRWGYFPSVSAGWRLSEEKFMEAARGWLTQLKIRASYGSLGNNATTSFYMYQSLYASANSVLNGNIASGFAQTILANPDLTWERTNMLDFGFDYTLLNGRLFGSFDWYNKLTDGILISLPAPLEHGTSTVPNQNAGQVRNRGFEFDINWSDRIGNVTYNVGFNMGYVRNVVTKFQGEVSSISGVYKIQEGHPINQIYVLEVDRIIRDQADMEYVQSLVDANPNYFATYQRPELGDFLYRDANGDGNLDADDRVEIGHGNLPAFTYGINIGVTWRDFNFSAMFQGVGDYKVYYNNQAFRFVTVMGQSLNKDITDNAWTPENPYNSKYPILRNNANAKNNVASDAFVHNGAYFRCKNLQIGYTIPRNITTKFAVSRLKVYFSVDNLFTITKFPGLDPEVGATVGYPAVKQYSIGLDISI
ncbi:MAG: TonB-dependent receptor [Muribaculaceae bacterium]|nr:TonB-dependent receptor [Muribaculaceae bacterium]